ncbi:TetR/AcrR family transcriptional regulator [Actinokineospora enzanensis]|uniref:TetR/AcrR family transcriptional regulator n=1 Tax=Actinokineospora enzanensis TaxID=155975 RepID=UPI00039DCA5E|nr:TetR/AcrR family transcriptional regulator [Actinokineospora enzanensis]
MPTGVAIRDAREQLFAAAERVLRRDGPNALTSRSVTGEAGVAKGVLHRHFTDFDEFLAELVYDRIARLRVQAEILDAAVGTGTIAANLTDALTGLLDSVAHAIVSLIIFRDELRTRLRRTHPRGIPLAQEVALMVTGYLTRERELGRIRADADIDALALTIVGTGHLMLADRSAAADPDAVHKVVASALAGAV